MRRAIKTVMYRTIGRALSYPPIFTVVRDFLIDNPEALFRVTSGRGMAKALAAQTHLLEAVLDTDTFKAAAARRPQLLQLLALSLPEVKDSERVPLLLQILSSAKDAESEALNSQRIRVLSLLLQPVTNSYSYAREIAALVTGLAKDHTLSGGNSLLHAFMSWRAMSAHLPDDWRKIPDLFDGLSTQENRSFKAILGHLVERLSDEGVIKLKGGEFRFNDAQAFAETCDEILAREQYYFMTDSPRPYVLDCGVNAGLAIYYVKQLHPNARVIGFEPHEPTANLARENVERLKLSDVTIHNSAVAGTEGEMQLSVSDNPLGHHLALSPGDDAGGKTVSVKTELLSKYVVEPVDFLKLDVEGAEMEVLFELGVERLKLVRNIFCEFHIDRGEQWDDLGKVLSLLRSAGLELQLEGAGWAQRSRSRRPMQSAGKHLSLSIYASRPARASAPGPA